MIAPEDLVENCRKALDEPQPPLAVKELVTQAVIDGVDGLSEKPGIQVLACDQRLTVLHVVIPGGRPKSLPHDHRMWAVIGIHKGQENNEFFRRAAGRLEEAGGRLVDPGEVLMLGQEVIHRIQNPLTHNSLGAIHVYGGDLLTARHSMWTEPDWAEEPYDVKVVTGTTFTPS